MLAHEIDADLSVLHVVSPTIVHACEPQYDPTLLPPAIASVVPRRHDS